MRNRTPDLRIPSSDAPPLSHRDSTRVKQWARVRSITKFIFLVSRSWQDEKHLSLFLYRAQNLQSLLFLFTKNYKLFLTFGTNSRAIVEVVATNTIDLWTIVLRGGKTTNSATIAKQENMNTLYTAKPMFLESFSEG